MEILSLLESMRRMPDCDVRAPAGLPTIRPHHLLPDDVRAFYRACSGFTWSLYVASRFWDSFSVLAPDRVVLANPMVCCISEEELRTMGFDDDEISWDWYVIAADGNGDYMSIDLGPGRLGRCYDSFHETHALRGQTPILGLSFTEFLTRIVARIEGTRHSNWNWVEGGLGTMSLGDAYDQSGLNSR